MIELLISKSNQQKIINHAIRSAPLEMCGILAGLGNKVFQVYSVPNLLKNSTRFQMEPLKQLKVLLKIEALGLEMIGYYHSHPLGPNFPSESDCIENYFPHLFSLIVSKEQGNWNIFPFLMELHKFTKIMISENETKSN